ncbi:AAA family ATPase [Devosia salina]|uniref:Tetratricopeptide repeat protein n=1 Tax=Devosia salina TaxID=2860336 RepID=A0ABX8WKV4_9HYPH|nr:AAA family ATPase [Devosia salina]QYO77646.1 tetratricopeptide repeat protein [Devosia salina]
MTCDVASRRRGTSPASRLEGGGHWPPPSLICQLDLGMVEAHLCWTMAAPLVATKLNLPILRHGIVVRQRLRQILDRSAGAKLTLISAPAGFGKTTLLADWLAQASDTGRLIAWLSLDESDNEPSAFWANLTAAIQATFAKAETAFPDLPQSGPADQGLIVALLNQLARMATPIVVILDDLHLVDRADIHEQLSFFIEHLPDHVHVVISTRADPGLPLARLRVRRDLVEIRSADLRFTSDEAAAYLDAMGFELSSADTATLEAKTEGWIAALQLAVLSLEGRDDPTAFIEEFAGTGRYIVDYLVEEVLGRLPDDLRMFLVATSALRRMSAPLCDFVLGEAGGSKPMLDRLERQNLFLVPLDSRRQWYRYHHLFADVLLAHLDAEQAQALLGIHRSASEWFEANGERAEAIHHALAARDFEWAAELIERALPQVRKHRQEALFRTWMKDIPDAIVRSRPNLAVGYAGILVSLGAFGGVEERLRMAETEGAKLENPEALLAQVELYRTALAQVRGDIEGAASHAHRVLALAPADDHLARASAAGFLGIVSWTAGELEDAIGFWTECRDGLRNQGHIADVQGTTIALADMRMTQGRLDDAERACTEALDLASRNGGPLARGAADIHASMAMLHLERGALELAREHLAKSSELGEVFGLPQYPYRLRVAQAGLALAEGRAIDAIALLREAERRYVSDFFPNVRPIPALIANAHIRLGHLDEADRWSRAAGVTADDTPTYLREFEHMTLARLLIAHGGPEAIGEALGLIDRLTHAAARGGRGGSLVTLSILAALAHQARHDTRHALESLRRAISLAEPEAIRRPFLDEGEGLAGLFAQLSKSERAGAFVSSLVPPTGDFPPPPAIEHPALIEPLSDRESDVLRMLRSDLSGPDSGRATDLPRSHMASLLRMAANREPSSRPCAGRSRHIQQCTS